MQAMETTIKMNIKRNLEVENLAALVENCKQGDQEAQKELYNLFYKKVYRICLKYCNNPFNAQDITQEVFIIIFNKINGFSGYGSFEGWVRRIAVNKALNSLEKRFHYSSDDILDTDYNSSSYELCDSNILDLHFMIDNLPNGYKTILRLYAVEGYSHKEISKMLKISEGTSKSQLFHARTALKMMIESEECQMRRSGSLLMAG